MKQSTSLYNTLLHKNDYEAIGFKHKLILSDANRSWKYDLFRKSCNRSTTTDVGICSAREQYNYRSHIDNSTASQLNAETFGDFHKRHHVKSQLISVPSVIVPDYGTAPPYFSASIPFVGSSVFLRNMNGEQFIAVYEVIAEVVQPQAHVVDVESAAAGTNITMTTLSATNQTGGQS